MQRSKKGLSFDPPSARPSSGAGIVRPSVLAVLLITPIVAAAGGGTATAITRKYTINSPATQCEGRSSPRLVVRCHAPRKELGLYLDRS
jgi:hypothetical protein